MNTNRVPPLDAVLLWVSTTIERDFAARGVFPTLRQTLARHYRASSSLHFLTPSEGQAVLADATRREQEVSKGLKVAYSAHVTSVASAIEEATERPGLYAAEAAICIDKCMSWEDWRGSKEHLRDHGIRLDGPWPGEPGGKERFAVGKDDRGYATRIKPFSKIWPGLYRATIEIPYEIPRSSQTYRPPPTEAERARMELAHMPNSADEFRAKLMGDVRLHARVILGLAVEPPKYHGYTLDADSVDEVHAAFDAVAEALMKVKVHFNASVHAEVEQQHRAKIASADTAFQSTLANLTKSNPQILDRGES